MNFTNLQTVADGVVEAFGARVPLTEIPAGEYAAMRYPKFPPIMRFFVRRYAAEGFGNVFSMVTRALFGKMQLATIAFTPNRGTDAPLLLVDCMAMGRKRAVFIEYYDCTAQGAACPALTAVAGRYRALADYEETPAWYVHCRAGYSLIKGGADDAALLSMLADSAAAYGQICGMQKQQRPENRAGLSAFIDRMVAEGNPSSKTMERVLGKAGAERFFRTLVMPSDFTDGKADAPGGPNARQ